MPEVKKPIPIADVALYRIVETMMEKEIPQLANPSEAKEALRPFIKTLTGITFSLGASHPQMMCFEGKRDWTEDEVFDRIDHLDERWTIGLLMELSIYLKRLSDGEGVDEEAVGKTLELLAKQHTMLLDETEVSDVVDLLEILKVISYLSFAMGEMARNNGSITFEENS